MNDDEVIEGSQSGGSILVRIPEHHDLACQNIYASYTDQIYNRNVGIHL